MDRSEYDDYEPDEDWLANEQLEYRTDRVEEAIKALRGHERADEIGGLLYVAEGHLDASRSIFVDGVSSAWSEAMGQLYRAEDALLEAERRIGPRRPRPDFHTFVDFMKLTSPCYCGAEMGWVENAGGDRVLYCYDCGEALRDVGEEPGFLATIGQARLFEVESAPSAAKPKSRRPIPDGVRAQVFMRANFRCEWCNASALEDLQIGHILSVRDGYAQGLTDAELNLFDNLILQCRHCNQGLGGESMPTWIVARILRARWLKKNPPPG